MASPNIHAIRASLRFAYQKSTAEIQEKVGIKLVAVRAKIAEREARVARVREEYDISDADMSEILAQYANDMVSNSSRGSKMSYSISSNKAGGAAAPGGQGGGDERIIGAGVVNNILTEKQLIETEKEAVEKLERIQRNLKPIKEWSQTGVAYMQDEWALTEEDIEYLGF
jgi:hypothetical protein